MKWGTVPTSDLVNLANQASHTLGESPKGPSIEILNLHLQQMKTPK